MKKVLILSALGVTSTVALAVETSTPKMYNTAPTASMAKADAGAYIEGLAGYNRYAFNDAYDSMTDPEYKWHNGQGNWALGASIGYQFQRNLSAELGGIYTFQATYKPKDTSIGAPDKLQCEPWYTYLAGKLSIPVYNHFNIFTKLGVGHQNLSVKSNDAPRNMSFYSQSTWGPMFGAGIAYNFTPSTYITGEWLRFTGKIRSDGDQESDTLTTAPNIFLVGIGYKFAI